MSGICVGVADASLRERASARRRFLILAQSRSGTQLLRALLHSHPAIHCDGELLHRDLQYTRHRLRRELLRIYPDPLLQQRACEAPLPVYGFNLMFYHLHFPAVTLRRLVRDGWHVIHLLREDLVQVALSFLAAERSGLWHREAGRSPSALRVRIEPSALEKELLKRTKWRAFELELVRSLPHQRLRYERDLAAESCWQTACDAVFAALGLDAAPVSASLRKTDPRGPEQIIENHAELQQWLHESRFARLVQPAAAGK